MNVNTTSEFLQDKPGSHEADLADSCCPTFLKNFVKIRNLKQKLED